MFERFTRKSLTATVAALVAALGVGGVAVAQSSGSGSQPPAATQQSTAPENSATDTDNIQSGDQTSPDPAGENVDHQCPPDCGPGEKQ